MKENVTLKIYGLVLNPMRLNTECGNLLAISFDRQKIIDYYNSFLVESYSEEGKPSFECHGPSHTWEKSFKKDSPLEWYNSHDYGFDRQSPYGHGIQEFTCPAETYESFRSELASKGVPIL